MVSIYSTLPQITSYEIKKAKTGELVPVVNGVHLHSIYDPTREAETFIKNNRKIIENKEKLLILGLGFGHHIKSTMNEMEKIHGDNFHITIIEPDSKLAQDCLNISEIKVNKNLTILHGISVEDLYQSKFLINYLLHRPGIIAHTASFNLHQEYYKNFLSYTASQTMEKICQNINTEELRNYLESFSTQMKFSQLIHKIKRRPTVENDLDYLLLAFDSMTPPQVQSSEMYKHE